MTDSIFGPGVIETYSGTAYKFEDPNSEIITIEDVANALGNICRFGGHTQRYYSVAEHSVLVSRILAALGHGDEWQEAGLLHDAGEAYTGDIPKPMKILISKCFSPLAFKADQAVGKAMLVNPAQFHNEKVKLADNIALKFEGRELMRSGAHRWNDTPLEAIPDLPEGVLNWPLGLLPDAARELFYLRAEALYIECPQRTAGVPYAPPLPSMVKQEDDAAKKAGRRFSTVTPEQWKGAYVT